MARIVLARTRELLRMHSSITRRLTAPTTKTRCRSYATINNQFPNHDVTDSQKKANYYANSPIERPPYDPLDENAGGGLSRVQRKDNKTTKGRDGIVEGRDEMMQSNPAGNHVNIAEQYSPETPQDTIQASEPYNASYTPPPSSLPETPQTFTAALRSQYKNFTSFFAIFKKRIGHIVLWMLVGSMALNVKRIKGEYQMYRDESKARIVKLEDELDSLKLIVDGHTGEQGNTSNHSEVSIGNRYSQSTNNAPTSQDTAEVTATTENTTARGKIRIY